MKTLLRRSVLFLVQAILYATLLTATKLQAQTVQPQEQSPTGKTANHFAHTKFTYKIIDAPNKTFGYDIYADGKALIHQPSIPAVAGNEGFKAKGDALKVAKLVIDKMKKGNGHQP